MRNCILFFIFLTIFGGASAQDIRFPPNCSGRLLTPMVEALCTRLNESASLAEEHYSVALSKAESAEQWNALNIVRMKFIAQYHRCAAEGAIQGGVSTVVVCLRPALYDVIDTLPKPSGEEYLAVIVAAKARQANRLAESRAQDAFAKCVSLRIQAIDDGISPARDIAQGMGQRCMPQALHLAEVRFASLSTSLIAPAQSWAQVSAATNEILDERNLVQAVLEYRATKRAEPPVRRQK